MARAVTQPPTSLTALEIASGLVLGEDPAAPMVYPRRDGGARSALESAVLPALAAGRCTVSFSGGRDSSAILALATHVARREGLPPPVPITLRFPAFPETDETHWQQLVVDHLGLEEWEVVDIEDGMDLLGPVATATLRRHGVLAPPNAFFHVPVLERTAGGTLLTGVDGDGLLEGWRWARPAEVLARRVSPRPAEVRGVAHAFAPHPVRRVVARRRAPALSWLTPEGRGMLSLAFAREQAGEPRRWDRWVGWYARRRELTLWREAWSVLAADAGAAVLHPLLDRDFLAALAADGGRTGPGLRDRAMQRLFGDLLPPSVLDRRDKALFSRVFWSRDTRDFVAGWDGGGVDRRLVDPAALRAEWNSEPPDARSDFLLQSAWLAASGGEAPQRRNDVGQ